VAFFGSETGFQMAAEHPLSIATGMVGHADITVPGVNSLTDGVLMVTPHGNDDNFATVEPKADGTGWDVDHYDNGTGREGPTGTNTDSINWIYLPYTTENLVAGRVNPDGTIINSTGVGTNPGEFTLTRDAAGEYLLSVAGRTPDQGMLLLNATGPAGSLDNSMVYEADGNAFRIIGLDMITSTESAAGEFVETEDTGFSFAFIDFITPPTLPGGDFAEADFNNSGVVDGADLAAWQAGFGTGTTKAQGDADADSDVDGNDFLVWQRQLGTTTTVAAAGAVPEPNVMVLTLLAGVGLLARTRQRTSVD